MNSQNLRVIAVVGDDQPLRSEYAAKLATLTQSILVKSEQINAGLESVESIIGFAKMSMNRQQLIINYPIEVPVTGIIGQLTKSDLPATLVDVVCVVDAGTILDALHSEHEYDTGSRARLLVENIEFASMISLVNTSAYESSVVKSIISLISHLNPSAKLSLLNSGESNFPEFRRQQEAPKIFGQPQQGWVSMLNDEPVSVFQHPEVDAFRYQNIRPFHPGRLMHVLDKHIESGQFGMVVRSMGFCRFATRPNMTALWDHVGSLIMFSPVAKDDHIDVDNKCVVLGQDLFFTGFNLERDKLTHLLDWATLTDSELMGNPDHWLSFPDPFPEWSYIDR